MWRCLLVFIGVFSNAINIPACCCGVVLESQHKATPRLPYLSPSEVNPESPGMLSWKVCGGMRVVKKGVCVLLLVYKDGERAQREYTLLGLKQEDYHEVEATFRLL